MPDVCRTYDAYQAYEAYEVWKGLFLTPSTVGNSFHRLRAVPLPRGGRSLGWKIEDLNNIGGRAMRELLPPLRRSPSLKEGGLWGGKSKVGRMSAGNCNCEMCLQRLVASLQRSDVFATVGCTAVPRRGAHCAPVYPRCYNNPSRGRAKGHRGDRKAPISNRRQGRRP